LRISSGHPNELVRGREGRNVAGEIVAFFSAAQWTGESIERLSKSRTLLSDRGEHRPDHEGTAARSQCDPGTTWRCHIFWSPPQFWRRSGTSNLTALRTTQAPQWVVRRWSAGRAWNARVAVRQLIDTTRRAHILGQSNWRRSHQLSRRCTQLFVCCRNNSSSRQVTSPTASGLNTD
jgi:hypothetical protein